MKKIFLTIVITSLVLQLIWFFLPYTWVYLYEGEEINLLSWSNYGAYIDMYGPIPYIIQFAYIVVTIGFVLFKKWARTTFLILTIATTLSSPVWGFYVSPPLDTSIGYLVTLADGAILAIAYLTSIGSELK